MKSKKEYNVDWDDASGAWCIFFGDKAIASFSSKEDAELRLDRLLLCTPYASAPEDIRLSVKGTVEDAQSAFSERKIEGVVFVSDGKGRTFWDVQVSQRLKVAMWFCEPARGDEEFPCGTLLFYR